MSSASAAPLTNHGHLHRAALDGDDEAIRQALLAGADINSLDEEGRTPIMCAVAGDRWQELDASDALFLTPQRLNAIRIMLRHPHISLHCLNAPHAAANGVIPLSMAAWLNFPELVQLLLEESADTVAVDGLDAHGATALMYAARDNSLQVVQLLLSHGARPDLRDCNFRSSVQYAIPHPQVLWLCETVLRRHRWRESQSSASTKLSLDGSNEAAVEELLSLAQCALPSFNQTPNSGSNTTTLISPPPQSIFTPASLTRSVKTLVSTLSSPLDLSFLRSVLFSPALPTDSRASLYPLSVPILVNKPDERGWSVIHHACSFTCPPSNNSPTKSSPSSENKTAGGAGGKIPEIEALDMLYLAGADISLFTTEEHYTPLHVFARTSSSIPASISPIVKQQIRDFATHLVRDLGAPLAAQDKHDETCLHVAAEYGAHPEVLEILLDLDRVVCAGKVGRMRNTRGMVPSEMVGEGGRQDELNEVFVTMKEKLDMAATVRRGSISSALSDNTIRGSEKQSTVSLTAIVVDEFGMPQPAGVISEVDLELSNALDINPTEHAQMLLAFMRVSVPTQHTLEQMDSVTAGLVKYFYARIDTAKKEVASAKKKREAARANMRGLDASLLSRAAQNTPAIGPGVDGGRTLKGRRNSWTRESEDSQFTRVSCGSEGAFRIMSDNNGGSGYAKVGEYGTVKGQGWTEWFEGLIGVADDGTVKKKKDKKEKVKADAIFNSGGGQDAMAEFGSAEKFARSHAKTEKEKGTVKLKNWWKKMMVTHDQPRTATLSSSTTGQSPSSEKPASKSNLDLVYEVQDPTLYPAAGHEDPSFGYHDAAASSFSSLALADDVYDTDPHVLAQKLTQQQQAAVRLAEDAEKEGEWTIGKALRTSPAVLGAARKDLEKIELCLRNADEYLKAAESSIERVGRVLKRALKKRRVIMDDFARSRTSTPTPSAARNGRATPERRTSPTSPSSPVSPGSPGLLGYDISLSLRPSYASISTVASDCTILTSTTSHHITHDDDETRTMRRLLLRRIEAQLRAAYDEVDRVVNWIQIVQGVVDGVRRRTYL